MGVVKQSDSEFSEQQIVFEATKDAIVRTRQALMFVSILVAFGFFYLFWWYGSWQLARIDARLGVAASIRQINNQGDTFTKSPVLDEALKADKDLIGGMERKAAELREEWDRTAFEVPLVGLRIASADFSIGILTVAAAMLMWLLFYQRRLDGCIKRLYYLAGSDVVTRVLQYHFVLIGSHATDRRLKFVARALLLALPALALCFLLSDCYDFYTIWTNPLQQLAFSSSAYRTRVIARLAVDLVLAIAVAVIGFTCYDEFKRAQEYVLEFTEDEQEPSKANDQSVLHDPAPILRGLNKTASGQKETLSAPRKDRSAYELDQQTREEIRPRRSEQLLAPSLSAWSELARDGSVDNQSWPRMVARFNESLAQTESRTRIAAYMLGGLVALLIPLTLTIGGSLEVLGRTFSLDPTNAPRWIEEIPVAVSAFLAWRALQKVIKLRRRCDWQASLLRQIVSAQNLIPSPAEEGG
jgi:hypothetical protein